MILTTYSRMVAQGIMDETDAVRSYYEATVATATGSKRGHRTRCAWAIQDGARAWRKSRDRFWDIARDTVARMAPTAYSKTIYAELHRLNTEAGEPATFVELRILLEEELQAHHAARRSRKPLYVRR